MIRKGILSLFCMILTSCHQPGVEGFTQQWKTLTQSSSAVEEAEAARRILAYASEQGLTWIIETQNRATSQPIPVGELASQPDGTVRVILTLRNETLFGKKDAGEFRWEPKATENVLILMRDR